MPLYVTKAIGIIKRVSEIRISEEYLVVIDSNDESFWIKTPSEKDAEIIAHKYRQCIDRPHEVEIL